MKINELENLKDFELKYKNAVMQLEERHKCNWDDPVHDSFGIYTRQIDELFHKVSELKCGIESVVNEVNELNINEMKERAKNLVTEANQL